MRPSIYLADGAAPQHRYNNALKEQSNAVQQMDTRAGPGSILHQT